ncbi:hypothetical protein C2G38_2089449 [Gigaspora rosea]|uniref:Uncharacterized protein n=1 Tax=Gigaspora rosea TaxID=44941 RepID=A0A397V6P0_9GLOM|nr:hypothetical protein C2G38_2089449 [Gigaspora rosea]
MVANHLKTFKLLLFNEYFSFTKIILRSIALYNIYYSSNEYFKIRKNNTYILISIALYNICQALFFMKIPIRRVSFNFFKKTYMPRI